MGYFLHGGTEMHNKYNKNTLIYDVLIESLRTLNSHIAKYGGTIRDIPTDVTKHIANNTLSTIIIMAYYEVSREFVDINTVLKANFSTTAGDIVATVLDDIKYMYMTD